MIRTTYKIKVYTKFIREEDAQKFHEYLLNEILKMQSACQRASAPRGYAQISIGMDKPVPGKEKRCAECRAGRQPMSHTIACPANALSDEDLIYPD